MIGILPSITKEYILSKISQEEIFEKYLNITVQTDSLFTSPLRKDNSPTCGFSYNINGKLRMRDFSGHFHGDCFDAVGRKLNIDANTKIGFNVILDNIARTFNLHKYAEGNYQTESPIILDEEYFKKVRVRSTIKVKIKQWDKYDLAYWKRFNIDLRILTFFNVYPVEKAWLNEETNYTYRINDPCYAYHFGQGEWKLYFPTRRNLRFITNSSSLQGKSKLTCGKACVITKSYKDVMAFKNFGIDAVAPSSEVNLISKEDYIFIKQRYNFVFSLMDYDNTGIRMSRKLEKVYNIRPLYFTDKIWNRKKGIGGTKDLTDYIAKFGVVKAKELVQKIYKRFEPMFEEEDIYAYEQLKWMK